MTLHYTLDRESLTALHEAGFRYSRPHRQSREWLRWTLILFAIAFWFLRVANDGLGARDLPAVTALCLLLLLIALNLRRTLDLACRIKLRMPEFGKNYGPATLTLDDGGLHATTPAGSRHHRWNMITHAELTRDHLFIFPWPSVDGFAIRVAEIGPEAAELARDYVLEHRDPYERRLLHAAVHARA